MSGVDNKKSGGNWKSSENVLILSMTRLVKFAHTEIMPVFPISGQKFPRYSRYIRNIWRHFKICT